MLYSAVIRPGGGGGGVWGGTPQTMFVFFFFAINVHGNTRYSKNGIPDQIDGTYTLFQTKMAKSIPYFRLEMLENGTLWGGTYLYGLYMGVPPGVIRKYKYMLFGYKPAKGSVDSGLVNRRSI